MASQYKASLIAYRIADNRYPIFDGNGAALTGGRWNSQGLRVIYASCSYAGAMLEKLAQTGIGSIPSNQQSIAIHVPDTILIEEITAEDIPGWEFENKASSCTTCCVFPSNF
jgi:RES domain-containing protein